MIQARFPFFQLKALSTKPKLCAILRRDFPRALEPFPLGESGLLGADVSAIKQYPHLCASLFRLTANLVTSESPRESSGLSTFLLDGFSRERFDALCNIGILNFYDQRSFCSVMEKLNCPDPTRRGLGNIQAASLLLPLSSLLGFCTFSKKKTTVWQAYYVTAGKEAFVSGTL